MANDVEWTRQMQVNTLLVIPTVRAVCSTAEPQFNIASGLREVQKLVPPPQDDAAFAEAAPDIISGLVNLAATLAVQFAAATDVPVGQVLDTVTESIQTIRLSD